MGFKFGVRHLGLRLQGSSIRGLKSIGGLRLKDQSFGYAVVSLGCSKGLHCYGCSLLILKTTKANIKQELIEGGVCPSHASQFNLAEA